MKKIALFVAGVCILSTVAVAKIPDDIILALKTGNAKELTKYFDTTIELVVANKENVYSKSQAEIILRDFFQQHTPENFILIHEGGKENSRYAIGNLMTNKGMYRIYFLFKGNKDLSLIHQLRIEKENDTSR